MQLEGSLGAGVAPAAGISLWKLIKFDTSLNPKVKVSANMNFDLLTPFLDSFYNSISGSKLSFDLELNSGGSVYLWKTQLFSAETITVGHNLWTGYIVPKFENFNITGKRGKMDIELDISNKLVYDSEIGMNIYEKDPKTGKFTVEVGTMKLCEYSKPPAGKNVYNLKKEEKTTLPPGKEYEARLTVGLNVMDELYSLETDVKTRFTIPEIPEFISGRIEIHIYDAVWNSSAPQTYVFGAYSLIPNDKVPLSKIKGSTTYSKDKIIYNSSSSNITISDGLEYTIYDKAVIEWKISLEIDSDATKILKGSASQVVKYYGDEASDGDYQEWEENTDIFSFRNLKLQLDPWPETEADYCFEMIGGVDPIENYISSFKSKEHRQSHFTNPDRYVIYTTETNSWKKDSHFTIKVFLFTK